MCSVYSGSPDAASSSTGNRSSSPGFSDVSDDSEEDLDLYLESVVTSCPECDRIKIENRDLNAKFVQLQRTLTIRSKQNEVNWYPWRSLLEGDEGAYLLPNCQTNLVIVLLVLSLLFWHFINTPVANLINIFRS